MKFLVVLGLYFSISVFAETMANPTLNSGAPKVSGARSLQVPQQVGYGGGAKLYDERVEVFNKLPLPRLAPLKKAGESWTCETFSKNDLPFYNGQDLPAGLLFAYPMQLQTGPAGATIVMGGVPAEFEMIDNHLIWNVPDYSSYYSYPAYDSNPPGGLYKSELKKIPHSELRYDAGRQRIYIHTKNIEWMAECQPTPIS